MKLQKTYRIRHKGIESTPHSMEDLRQMWKSGQIDAATQFQLGGSGIWLEATDLLAELEFVPANQPAPPQSLTTTEKPSTAIEFRGLHAVTNGSLKVTSIRIPFREVLVLVLKFYLATAVLAAACALLWLVLAKYFR